MKFLKITVIDLSFMKYYRFLLILDINNDLIINTNKLVQLRNVEYSICRHALFLTGLSQYKQAYRYWNALTLFFQVLHILIYPKNLIENNELLCVLNELIEKLNECYQIHYLNRGYFMRKDTIDDHFYYSHYFNM